MKSLRIVLFVWCILPTSMASAQINLTLGKLDSLKNDAKALANYLQNTERDLKSIKEEKLKKEAKAISGDLRRSLRQNLNSGNNKPTPANLPTNNAQNNKEGGAEGKLEVPSPLSDISLKTNNTISKTNSNTNSPTETNATINALPNTKPQDVHDLWVESSKKELELLNEQERNKENQLIALKQALELQIRANEMQTLRQANWAVAGGGVVCVLLLFTGFLVRTNRITKKSNQMLAQEKQLTEQERDKSEALLLNILPLPIAQELKTNGKALPRQYKMASALFTDFKGFTTVAEKMTPNELIGELDECFAKFDEIITSHRLEKIKTIGDAYMCVGGIPEANTTNAIDAVLAGLEIQRFMEDKRAERLAQGKEYWFLRLGINTGEVVAGVIGKKKFAYDVWGDTVNTASRLESSGEIGKVNISGKTYEHIKDLFVCTYRGRIDAKNKGAIDMYFVDGILPELSENGAGKIPNKAFWEKAGVAQ